MFKYENRNGKKIRLKDILILFSVFTLCIITAMVTGNIEKNNKKASVNTAVQNSDVSAQTLEDKEADTKVQSTALSTSDTKTELYENPVELVFEKPVGGAVIKPFSITDSFYSETMDDWRMHTGVDIACPIDSEVKSAESGVVNSVEYDINYGHTVIIESGEYSVIYSSLSSEIPVKPGQNVSKGDIIGKTADTCMVEICDEPHIHIEMKKSGEYVDPLEYIQFN